MIRRRGALLGSFVLATAPAFLLGARQLTTNAPLLLGTSLAVGGLVRLCWPPAQRRLATVIARWSTRCWPRSACSSASPRAPSLVGVVAPLATVAVALAARVTRPQSR